MYSLEESFRTGMAIFQAVMYASIFESYRPEIEAELKKVIGRKLTNDEWLYLIRETWGKVQVDREQEQFRQWFQQLAGRKIIHEFVWNS